MSPPIPLQHSTYDVDPQDDVEDSSDVGGRRRAFVISDDDDQTGRPINGGRGIFKAGL